MATRYLFSAFSHSLFLLLKIPLSPEFMDCLFVIDLYICLNTLSERLEAVVEIY